MSNNQSNNQKWTTNFRVVICGLVLWVIVSFGAGMFLHPKNPTADLNGSDMGFWFVQQGSILLLLTLIFVYAMWKNRMPPRRRTNKPS